MEVFQVYLSIDKPSRDLFEFDKQVIPPTLVNNFYGGQL